MQHYRNNANADITDPADGARQFFSTYDRISSTVANQVESSCFTLRRRLKVGGALRKWRRGRLRLSRRSISHLFSASLPEADYLPMSRCLMAMRVVHSFTAKVLMMLDRMFSSRRKWPMISMAIVEVMIHVPVEMLRPMEPGSGSDENAACEPLGAIVAIGSAIVRRLLIVPIRTYRRRSDFYRNLRGRFRRRSQEEPCGNRQKTKMFQCFHSFSFQLWVGRHVPHAIEVHFSFQTPLTDFSP